MKTRFATRGVIDTPELKLFAGMHGARWYAKLSSGLTLLAVCGATHRESYFHIVMVGVATPSSLSSRSSYSGRLLDLSEPGQIDF